LRRDEPGAVRGTPPARRGVARQGRADRPRRRADLALQQGHGAAAWAGAGADQRPRTARPRRTDGGAGPRRPRAAALGGGRPAAARPDGAAGVARAAGGGAAVLADRGGRPRHAALRRPAEGSERPARNGPPRAVHLMIALNAVRWLVWDTVRQA